MIKIAFVIDTIESPSAGTEKQLLLLIKHLDRSKFLPYLCVLRHSDWLKHNLTGCEVVDVGVTSFYKGSSYLNILKFRTFLKVQKIDIVQTHFTEGNKVGVLAAKLAGVKAIVSTRRNQGYWHNRLEILILNALNNWVTLFLANSENTRQWAGKTEGLALSRIKVIHNALETESYFKGSETERSAFRAQIGFACDSVIVGIVANLRPVKAIDMFVRAAKIVSACYPQVHFLVVGEGPERERLEQLGAELGLTSKIRFLGKRLDIPEILSCLDIGILSSSSESFSNSVVEYLAAGLPVVCTDVGGAREAVEDGINGFVVPSGDFVAMAEKISLVLSSETMVLMKQSCRNKAETLFSLNSIVWKYEHFYEDVVKS